jgi:formylglycine-generating enzyme required for sulfatase activity
MAYPCAVDRTRGFAPAGLASLLVLSVACGGRTRSDHANSESGGAPGAMTQPSCDGLPATCGPQLDADCCASNVVPGGTFYRDYDGVSPPYMSRAYPATLSDFKLDTYEISVGRFRNFVAAYSPASIPEGAGKNPHDASDSGFGASDRASLPLDAAALEASLLSCGAFSTWSRTPGDATSESRPINCLTWYEAAAFCIWDGGRLPTDAEWNYAASGGAEQRVYPWGNSAPAADSALAIYDCYYGPSDCMTLANIAPCGSVPAGNGKWGHADLAGNLWEWVEDYFVSPLVTPCADCAYRTPTSAGRVVRGGGFDYDGATPLRTSDRLNADPGAALYNGGARCARNP